MRAYWLLLWFLLLGGVFPGARAATAIVEVRHRPPKEMAGLVRPVLEQGEAAVAISSGLLLKAEKGRLEDLRRLVERLDVAPAGLIVTVLQSDALTVEALNAGGEAEIALPRGPVRARGHLYQSRSDRSLGTRQRLRVLEGQPAFLFVGEEIPVPVVQLYGSPPQLLGGIEYEPATTGFQVVARLVGERVRLEISPWSRRATAEGGFATRAAATTWEVAPGRWIELGGHGDDEQERSASLPGFRYGTRRRTLRIFLKVEPAPR